VPSTAPPRIAGKAVLGSRLTAAARWGVPPTTVTWQWLRDGRPVPGATSSTYTPTVADLGTRLTVRATARKADYAPATVTSTPTTPVAKAPATTRVRLSRSAARYGAKVRATVTVEVPAGTPSGTVTLRADGRTEVTWSSESGRTYILQRADGTPSAEAFVPIATGIAPDLSGTNAYVDDADTDTPRFYRVLLESPAAGN